MALCAQNSISSKPTSMLSTQLRTDATNLTPTDATKDVTMAASALLTLSTITWHRDDLMDQDPTT